MSAYSGDAEKGAMGYEGPSSSPSVEIASEYEPAKSSGNIFKRVIDGFKPPEDISQYEHLTSQERAAIFLGRSKPKLSRRHLMVISLSSCVGTGLFIGSGSSMIAGGPASLLIGFGVMGIGMICTMATVGEIGVRYPTISIFYEIPARFLHPSFGFAVGWIYAFCWLVTVPLEMIASAQLTQFWSGDDNSAAKVNPVAWVSIIWFFDIIINVSGSRVYGELEFLIGCIKMSAMIGFIIFSIINVCGGPPTDHYLGAHNFYNPRPFMNSFKGVIHVLVSCSFAYGGTEVSGLAAAETANPLKAIPSATRQAFWRILIFFMVGILMVCFMVGPTTPGLGNSNEGSGSPFLVAISTTGVYALPSIFNAVIICSVIGVSNAAIYAATRTLTSLAVKGANLKWFCYVDREGRPLVSLLAVMIFSCLCFVSASDKYNDVFNWLYAFAALAFLFAWASINLCYLRMYWAFKSQGRSPSSEFVYRSPFGIVGAIIGGGISIATLGLQFWIYIWPLGSDPDPEYFFQNDLSVPFFLALLIGHKVWYWKSSTFVSNKDLDLDSGVRQFDMDALEATIAEDKEKNRKNPLRMIASYIF